MSVDTATLSTIREFVETEFPSSRVRGVGDDDSLVEQGVVDSLGVLEIAAFLEERFGVVLEDDDIVSGYFTSITTLAELVETRRTVSRV